MFIFLDGLLLIVGLFTVSLARKALKAGQSGAGWIMAAMGSLLIVAAALMMWALFAFYSQPCSHCM
jgi:hypothetical protein